jgi:tetratricopeptide (TPR) repeat protein
MMKKYLSAFGIILGIAAIFFGSIFPFLKANSYIRFIQSMPKLSTIAQFESAFRGTLDYFSPVGEEEVVKFSSSDLITNLISQDNPEAVSRELVSIISPYLFKDDVRHLIMKGNLYRIMWQKYRKADDFSKSEESYRAALAIGPKLPPVLYSLFDLYREAGDANKVLEIGSTILKYWPSDEQVGSILRQLTGSQSAATNPVR